MTKSKQESITTAQAPERFQAILDAAKQNRHSTLWRLTEDVVNPSPDRRSKHVSCQPIWKAGLIVRVQHHSYHPSYSIGHFLGTYSHHEFDMKYLWHAVEPYEPMTSDECLASGSLYGPEVLQYLWKTGVISLDQLKDACRLAESSSDEFWSLIDEK